MSKKEEEKDPPIKVMRAVQEFLAEEEIAEKGKELSKFLQEFDDIKKEAKDSADEFKKKLKAKETEVAILKDAINLGYEMVQRECVMTLNRDKTIREYTIDGTLVDTEPMRAEDYQNELPLGSEEEEEEEHED